MSSVDLLHHLITAIVVLDQHQRVIRVNSAAESLFALSERKLTGLPITSLLQLPDSDSLHLSGNQFSSESYTLNDIPVLRHSEEPGSVSVTMSLSPLPDDQQLVELHRADQRQHLSEESQQQAQQQAAQELVRSLAHEIKNPLGGLRGAAQLLSRELADSELKDYTQMIIEQADRLRALVDRLLGPQRLPQRSLHNLHQITERVCQLLSLQLPPGVQIVRDYDPSLPEISVDAHQIEQAVLNLAKNALEALRDSGQQQGQLILRTRSRRQVTLHGQRYRLALEVAVIDNGPGIPEQLRDTLFYPMITGKAGGTGLGLSIAQSLVNLHQGRLECHSQPGQTEFIIQLPLIEPSASAGNTAAGSHTMERA